VSMVGILVVYFIVGDISLYIYKDIHIMLRRHIPPCSMLYNMKYVSVMIK